MELLQTILSFVTAPFSESYLIEIKLPKSLKR